MTIAMVTMEMCLEQEQLCEELLSVCHATKT